MPLSETVLLLMALLTIGVLVGGIFKKLPVPYTVMLVVVGMLLGNLATAWPALEPIRNFHLSPELVLFVFLPVLIFESGFSLNARQLGKDIIPVLILAIPALLVSTSIVGLGAWFLLPLDLTTALLFGALISATDPVAVVALFRELGTPQRLTILVEGESLLNDATAIVVFSILLGLALHGGFAVSDIGSAVLRFVEVFFGGTLLGLGFGLLISWLVIRLQLEISSVLISSVILAYTAFIVAEHVLHLSGVMAVVAAAISFGIFALPRLPEQIGHSLHRTWEFLADVTNTLLFLMIGVTVDLHNLLSASAYILLISLLVIVARACSVYSFVPLAVRLFKLPTVTMGERHIMWWGGLKGGLAIAIVLSIPAELAGRDLLLNLTLGVVLFSLLVNAPTIRSLIEKLGLDRLSADEEIELEHSLKQYRQHTGVILGGFLKNRLLSAAGHYQATREVKQCMEWSDHHVSVNSLCRKQRLNVLREEGRELERLFSAGVIPQYSYLDINAELGRKRDDIVNSTRVEREDGGENPNLFSRFESTLIRRLRESDWASNLLAGYQNVRISQHIAKDMVRILMAQAAIDYIGRQLQTDLNFDNTIIQQYQNQLQTLHHKISGYQRDFSEFYHRFETRFAKRAALISAIRDIESDRRKGAISSKVFTVLERAIGRALDQMPVISEPIPDLKNEELIGLVPLFSSLSSDALKSIAASAASVSYLPGDVIIGEGEHGDALYIVVKGSVRVSHRDDHGKIVPPDLVVGDFFGEMALLGEHIRKATVTAHHASTLLRLTAAAVMEISRQFPEIGDYLNNLKKQREDEFDHQ